MANAVYGHGLEAFAKAQINWETDTIKAILIDFGNYTPDFVNHQFLSDIPALARVSVIALTSALVDGAGTLDADDPIFISVTGPTVEAVLLYKDTGVESSSPLIALIDTATGLPCTPNGGNITVQWDNGTFKIFRL
jgi:hypothetical protein